MRIDSTRTAAAILTLCLVALGAGCGDSKPNAPTPVGQTWALTVSVLNEQRAPIRNATVRVTDGPNASRTAMTDESGSAVFTALQQGTFGIEVTAQEYYRATASVALTTSRTVSVTMKERNRAPVIGKLATVGTLPNQPSGLAEVGEELQVVATVTDVETTPDKLTFAWVADVGTVTGTGPAVRWRAPSSGAWPATATIGVTIIERFTPPDSTQTEENRTTGELKVRVHDSKHDVANLASTFLLDFSNSTVPADIVVRNFSLGARCGAGRSSELGDVTDNRLSYRITAHSLGAPVVTLSFQGTSPFRARASDAWASVRCGWTSVGINPAIPAEYNQTMTSAGTCWLTAVYDVDDWALCWSDFEANVGSAGARFMR